MTDIQNPSFESGTDHWSSEFNNGWSTGNTSDWHTDGSWCGYTTLSKNRNPGDYSLLTQELSFDKWTAITFDVNLPNNQAFEFRLYIDDDLLYSHGCDGQIHLDCLAEAKYTGEHTLKCGIYCISSAIPRITTYVDNFRTADIVTPPTISPLSWTPSGDHVTIAAGATLLGSTEDLKVASLNPAHPDIDQGEAMLALVNKAGEETSIFVVAEGDHFRFDNKEWWALNIICGPECDLITLADEVAQFEKIPKIGDEIQFTAAIDFHGKEMSTVRWFYAKAPNECFIKTDLYWIEFAVGENTNMPVHTFEDEGDEEITFFMVTATNTDFATGVEDTLCGPIFNMWKPAPAGFMEGWLIAAFMAFILPALATKTEYFADLVFDGDTDSDTPSGGFSLLWAPVTFVVWIAEAAAAVAEDTFDIIFGTAEAEDSGGFSIWWTAAEFVAWLYRSFAAMVEDILDLVFGED